MLQYIFLELPYIRTIDSLMVKESIVLMKPEKYIEALLFFFHRINNMGPILVVPVFGDFNNTIFNTSIIL